MAALPCLAIHYEFSEYLEDALRDHFVCGIQSENTQRRLLTEKDLSFAHAIELVQGMEAAEKNTHSFNSTEVPIQKIRQSATPSGTACRQNPAVSGNPCYRCGKKNHSAVNCRFKDAVCNHYQKKGHLAKVCHHKLAQQLTEKKQTTKQQRRGANWVHRD